MRASVIITASTQRQARERAESTFRDFYDGGVAFRIVEESAESYTVELTGEVVGEVVGWRCEFVAEESES